MQPYSQTALAKEPVALKEAGAITFENTGNVWQDLNNVVGKELGEGDLDVRLAPTLGKGWGPRAYDYAPIRRTEFSDEQCGAGMGGIRLQ